jgi:hypothetical protein
MRHWFGLMVVDGASKTSGHHRDHGPGDHRGMMGRQALMVADGTAVLADPGKVRSTTHLRGST